MIWLIILIPISIALLAKFAFKLDISWPEFATQLTAGVVAVSLIWVLGYFGKASDREVLSGAVTSTYEETFRCPRDTSESRCQNSYSCDPYQVCTTTVDSKGNSSQSCTTHWHTCYRYSWEREWYADSDVGTFTISRVDAQGATQPPRHAAINIGDPVSITHNYQNWVKASSGTLFRDADSTVEKYTGKLPAYPIEIYDYYKINRVVLVNTHLPNGGIWNDRLSEALSTLGPQKEMNLILVFVSDVDPDYAYALRRHWDGFKKNDAVVFIGLRNNNVSWVETLSWSKNPAFDIKTRLYLSEFIGQPLTALSPDEVVEEIAKIGHSDFERRSMKEYEYLRGDISPPTSLVWISIIISIIMGISLSVLFHQSDPFGSNQHRFRRY